MKKLYMAKTQTELQKMIIDNHEYEYYLDFKRKKNTTMTVNKKGVFVHASWYMSKKQIISFITKYLPRMQEYYSKKILLNKNKTILDFNTSKINIDGIEYELSFTKTDKTSLPIKRKTVLSFKYKNLNELKKSIKTYLIKLLNIKLKTKINFIKNVCKKLSIKQPIFFVKYSKTKLGCFYPREHKILLSANLMFYSGEVLDYVIIHELCHAIHRNHQTKFWNLVASICPNWKAIRKTIKKTPIENVL